MNEVIPKDARIKWLGGNKTVWNSIGEAGDTDQVIVEGEIMAILDQNRFAERYGEA